MLMFETKQSIQFIIRIKVTTYVKRLITEQEDQRKIVLVVCTMHSIKKSGKFLYIFTALSNFLV